MKRPSLSLVLWGALIVAMVVLAGCSQPAVASAAPEEVVDAFYRWYLGYPGNPMVDRAYHESEYLTAEFKAEVDDILSSFTGGGYDPFLMAQDIPEDITVQDVSVSGNEALVTVLQSWSGGFTRELDIRLQLVDGEWLISGIVMPKTPTSEEVIQDLASASPEAVVQGFYTWYLDHVAGENRNNPLVDDTWRSTGYLTERLVGEMDELLASFEGGGYDPFLCGQDIPDTIAVGQPVVSDGSSTVLVETSFEGHNFQVELAKGQEGWKILGIGCGQAAPDEQPSAEPALPANSENVIPADWQVMRDDAYGFEIWYPADWEAVEIPLRDEGPENSMVRMVSILPAEWAAKLNQGGPPDPNNNVVAPVSVEVSLGNLEEYRWLYYEMPLSQEIAINGATVVLEQDEPSDYQVSRYMFQHLTNSDLRVTLVDYISGFSDRAAGNEAIIDTLNRIVATFSFTN